MMMKKINWVGLVLSSLLLMSATASASEPVRGQYINDTLRCALADCREMALTKGSSSRSLEEAKLVAKYNREAALAAMMPRVSANAAYAWNSRDAHLLADQTTFSFGTATVMPDGSANFSWSGESPLGKIATATEGTHLHQPVMELENDMGQKVADAYQQMYDMMTVDLTHVLIGQVGVTQPIYVGGRLIQMYKIAESTEKMAAIRSEAKHEDVLVSVDEAYWRVVAVSRKHDLAENYYQLLVQLEQDVQELVDEGVATQADLLKVTTKRGEAEVKKLQAENGLLLSQMALAQVCGLPLNTAFKLDETGLNETSLPLGAMDAEAAVASRSEIQLLEESEKIAKSNMKIVAAGLQPNIVATAGYIYTNPNAENGIRSDWHGHGFFSAGVAVNVPIVHADDILRYKAAKHAANMVALQTEEAKEMLTLQTTQANQRLMEAQQKIALARLTEDNATEVLRMARESFDAGMITSSELMQAQTAWLAAATDLVDAETEAKTTETLVRKYMGRL